jgi:hypothetical protein
MPAAATRRWARKPAPNPAPASASARSTRHCRCRFRARRPQPKAASLWLAAESSLFPALVVLSLHDAFALEIVVEVRASLGYIRIANPLPILRPGGDQRRQDDPGPLRKQSRPSTRQSGGVRATRDRSGHPANNLKTVARKGLWVRVPRPPLKGPLTSTFAIPKWHSLQVRQLSRKPLSQVLGLPDSSYRIGVRREIGPKDRERRRIWRPFGNPRRPRGGES